MRAHQPVKADLPHRLGVEHVPRLQAEYPAGTPTWSVRTLPPARTLMPSAVEMLSTTSGGVTHESSGAFRGQRTRGRRVPARRACVVRRQGWPRRSNAGGERFRADFRRANGRSAFARTMTPKDRRREEWGRTVRPLPPPAPKVETMCDVWVEFPGRPGRAMDILRFPETLNLVCLGTSAWRRAGARCPHAHTVDRIKGRAAKFA